MNTNTEIKTWQERAGAPDGDSHRNWFGIEDDMADEITDLRAEIARLQAALSSAEKRVRYLEILVDAYGPKSLQYDIEHPCDGLNALAERDAKQVQGELPPLHIAARNVVSQFNDPHVSLASVARYINDLEEALAQRVGSGEPVSGSQQRGALFKEIMAALRIQPSSKEWVQASLAACAWAATNCTPPAAVTDAARKVIDAWNDAAGLPDTSAERAAIDNAIAELKAAIAAGEQANKREGTTK
jgi:hypothetical protein